MSDDRFANRPLPHGDFWGPSGPADPRVTARNSVRTSRQQYREGAQPWSNLTDKERGYLYDRGEVVETPGGYEVRRRDLSSMGLVEEFGEVRRKKVRAGTGTSLPKTRKSTVRQVNRKSVDKSRAAANRARQVDEYARRLVNRDPADWQRWMGTNVPKSLQNEVVMATIAMGTTVNA
ncbi:hypothetical protein BH762_gp016 [Gordonia phage OneUp]|uniref:Uncharacterized protein n=1 Tax=Gordonia phage OneUp TaxID=1838074 RepID=A0A160DF51_9CAUD|nr:hypothetical protein BH762_gp016 [Gordonia phage OneUp]ANA86502.1 hypothetical protein PBI_ONEUP_169 [Gordonia phage OneUp]